MANKIILVANKCEYEDEADLYRDVYRLGFGDPLLVSAEQGDGMQDLIKTIEENIPEEMKKDFEARKGKRIEKFRKLKEKLKREILDLQRENKDDNDGLFGILNTFLKLKLFFFRYRYHRLGKGVR